MKVRILNFLLFEPQEKDLAIWKTIIAMYSTILIATAINKFTFWINLQRCDKFFLTYYYYCFVSCSSTNTFSAKSFKK